MKKIIELINKFYHKHQALILIIVVFVLIISGILINNIDLNKNNKTTQQIIEEEKKSFVVNIKGEVNKERSISLNEATYLYEIINMCDGFSNYADIDNINLIEIINTDRDINVKKTDIKHNNEIKFIDISNTYDTCLLYLGRINDSICIYKINKNSDFNIGELCLSYGGGGHANAGTCQLDNDKIDGELPTIINKLNGKN